MKRGLKLAMMMVAMLQTAACVTSGSESAMYYNPNLFKASPGMNVQEMSAAESLDFYVLHAR